MRFEVRYPAGDPHEVELQGTFAVLGRDPSCDLVLNDVKCSRRHAVMEAGPDGLAIRDTDSANGIFVNGQKVERARLHEGDLVRLGEIVLRVLPEQITGTVIMGPEDLVDLVPSPSRSASPSPGAAIPAAPPVPGRRPVPPTEPLAPPPPGTTAPPRGAFPPPPRPSPPAPVRPTAASIDAAPGRPVPARPLTVQVLAALWILAGLLYVGSGAFLAARGDLPSPYGIVALVVGALLALGSAAMAFGLWARKSWARALQIGVAAVGILNCPMTLASATVLVYMLRKPAALWFSGREPGDASRDETAAIDLTAETTFALTILAMVVLGALLSAGSLYVALRQS